MPFNAKLPEWFAIGLEPNTSQKTTGYEPKVKPPAQWFNWHLNTTYLALKELQEEAVNQEVITERFDTTTRKAVTLAAGTQIINAQKLALFSLEGATGRMLVNLLGREGECERIGNWSSTGMIVFDNTLKTSGTGSLKMTVSGTSTSVSGTFLTTPGKWYVAVADVRNSGTTKTEISIRKGDNSVLTTGTMLTDNAVWGNVYARFVATDFYHLITLTGTGAAITGFNMDSVRVYEISSTEFTALAGMSNPQVAERFPFVSSVMPVRNPYAIRYGENLLPSFYEWSAKQGTPSIVSEKSVAVTIDNKIVHTISPLVPGQKYTVSVQSGGATGRVTVTDEPESAIIVEASGSGLLSATFTATSRAANIRLLGTSSTAVTMSNPMLNIGSTAKPFRPREDSMLALQTDLYADPVTGANADTVFERDGQYFKNKRWQGLRLDGNQAWVQGEGGATGGVRQVKLVGAALGAVAGSGIGVKFDGKILPQGSTGNTADSNAVTAAGDIYFGIPVADSGWADGYGPTQDDIKAFFFGYKAYDANTITPANAQASTTATWNGTGTKYWVQRVGAATFTQTVPTQSYAGYTPYQLVYQLATPVVEPIVSEGQLSFVEGDNQVEVGTGIVLRESARPKLHTNGFYYINNSNVAGTNLAYSVSKVLGIYKGLRPDTEKWALYIGSGSTNGLTAEASAANYDAAAAYSVTYLMLAPSPVVPLTGSYAANEKTLLSDLVDSVQQNTARVSVLENKKAEKDNPAWLTPTLINGATNTSASEQAVQYLKTSSGEVIIRGVLTVTALNADAFRLPVGYRPSKGMRFVVSANAAYGQVVIGSDGSVRLGAGALSVIDLSGIEFLAEQ